jgi:hypothetical protein
LSRPRGAESRSTLRPALALVLLAAALAAAGCGGSSPGASFVPANVAAYVAVDTDPESAQWRDVDALAKRFPGRRNAVGSLGRSVRSGSGLDYEEDVRPALGPELDLAWLDLKCEGSDVVGRAAERAERRLRRSPRRARPRAAALERADPGGCASPLRSAVEYAASRPSEVQLTLFVRIG